MITKIAGIIVSLGLVLLLVWFTFNVSTIGLSRFAAYAFLGLAWIAGFMSNNSVIDT